MAKRGYISEYKIKKLLQKEFGDNNVIKTATGQNSPDFLVIINKVATGVEIKSTKGKRYYPKKHDIEQWWFLKDWMSDTGCNVLYCIRTKEKGKSVWTVLSHREFGNEYIRK